MKPFSDTVAFYERVVRSGDVAVQRLLCKTDRYFLLTQALGVRVALHPWVYERCREVEADPDGHLDLWSRGHFKSTIITYAGVVQEILQNPEICVCIMSYKAGAAKGFLSQIKQAFETSDILLACFPDILWSERPTHQGDRWSVEGGVCVKRRSTRKEATVQASGLVEGQLTGGHYDLLVYDDVVTLESVYTPEQAQRTTDAFSMSGNLASTDTRRWYIGTRYAVYDTYAWMMETAKIPERRHLAIDEHGDPVYWSREELEQRKREMTTKDWASQIMQQPTGEGELVFRPEWLMRYNRAPNRDAVNVGILIDSANAKRTAKGGSDYTVMAVVAWARDKNWYLLDAVRDRMSLAERTATLFSLVERWQPNGVFWEQIGAMSDVAHVREKQDETGWHFGITELHQTVPKEDRIHWLEPLYRNSRIWMPFHLWRRGVDGAAYDFMEVFEREEFLPFPSVRHDDMLDCLANIMHPTVQGAMTFPVAPLPPGISAQDTARTATSEWTPDGW